mmetsp:Transcript_132880/g.384190  ORF Transcript_132880/g.384190 Transcript_132880/m.384190 type:complete len:676 (-) Transcript_132880:166-2193(-)
MDALTVEEKRFSSQKPHRCTDILCIPVFLGTLAFLGYLLHYASVNGDMARVYHGIDFQNNLCGVSPEVKDKPYLFWCAKPGSKMTEEALVEAGITNNLGVAIFGVSSLLDLAHPICTSACPSNRSTFNSCYQREIVTDGSKDITGSFTRTIKYEYDFVEDHPTTNVADRYCMPHTMGLLQQLTATLSIGTEGVMFHLAQVLQHWHLVAAASVLAVLLGYTYMFLVKTLARPLIYISFAASSLACLIFGGWMLLGVFRQDAEETFAARFQTEDLLRDLNGTSVDEFFPSTGHKTADTAISITLLVIGLLIAIAACCLKRSIDIVVSTLAATLECLQDMPIMLAQPLIGVVLRMVYLAVAFIGLVWMVSIGDVARVDVHEYVPAGFARTFTYDNEQLAYIGIYTLIALWLLEFGAALEQFSFIYSTQMWFFAPYGSTAGMRKKQVNQFWMLRGSFLGLTYHLGTLAFGSALLAILRGLYLVLSFVYKQAKDNSEDNNAVVNCAAGCCLCCIACWEKVIRYMNKMVYVIVSIRSESFCASAEEMVQIVATEFAALGMLEGATKLFQLGGLISITGSGGYLSWLVLTKVSAFNSLDSPHFVPQPEYVTAAAAIASFIIAGVFMDVFDTVSDTILFCWAVDKKTRKESGLPPNEDLPGALRDLFGGALRSKSGDQQPLVE